MEEFFNNLFRHICPTGVKRLCLESSFFLILILQLSSKAGSPAVCSCGFLFVWRIQQDPHWGQKIWVCFWMISQKMSVSSGMWKSSWKDTFGFFQDAQIVNSNFIWVISGIDYRLAWKLEELASKFAIFTQSHFWWSSQTMTFFFFQKNIAFYSLWP